METLGLRCWQGVPQGMREAHTHHEIEINFVIRGGLTYLFGGTTLRVESGQLVVFWGTLPHQLIGLAPDTELIWVTLPLATFLSWELPRPLVDALLGGQAIQEPQRSTDLSNLCDWQHDLANHQPESQRIMLLQLEARLRRLAFDLQHGAPQTPKASPGDLGRVEKMAAYIAQNYASSLTIEAIAAQVGVHPNYAMHLFRREFGSSLGDFITRTRLSHAQRLLATTGKGVLEIAFACGFGSSSRFHSAFKNQCGCSPSRYRRQLNPQTKE